MKSMRVELSGPRSMRQPTMSMNPGHLTADVLFDEGDLRGVDGEVEEEELVSRDLTTDQTVAEVAVGHEDGGLDDHVEEHVTVVILLHDAQVVQERVEEAVVGGVEEEGEDGLGGNGMVV